MAPCAQYRPLNPGLPTAAQQRFRDCSPISGRSNNLFTRMMHPLTPLHCHGGVADTTPPELNVAALGTSYRFCIYLRYAHQARHIRHPYCSSSRHARLGNLGSACKAVRRSHHVPATQTSPKLSPAPAMSSCGGHLTAGHSQEGGHLLQQRYTSQAQALLKDLLGYLLALKRLELFLGRQLRRQPWLSILILLRQGCQAVVVPLHQIQQLNLHRPLMSDGVLCADCTGVLQASCNAPRDRNWKATSERAQEISNAASSAAVRVPMIAPAASGYPSGLPGPWAPPPGSPPHIAPVHLHHQDLLLIPGCFRDNRSLRQHRSFVLQPCLLTDHDTDTFGDTASHRCLRENQHLCLVVLNQAGVRW